MNGVDWTKYRGAYELLLEDIEDREEMQNVIMQMIGELNASHTGVSGGEANLNAIQTRSNWRAMLPATTKWRLCIRLGRRMSPFLFAIRCQQAVDAWVRDRPLGYRS
jgi:hypothetical protein